MQTNPTPSHAPAPSAQRPQRLLKRAVPWAAAVLGLALVFSLYRDPMLMVTLADQLWSCF
ncbi:MAG: hypothetical protein WAO62_00030 [Burkholderiaceae bacterium]